MSYKLIQKTLLTLSLLTSSSLFADSLGRSPRNTLIYNGFNAASWGEIGIDSGVMDEINVFGLRISAGIQVLRYQDYVSFTVGYMGSGFNGAAYPMKVDDGEYTYGYYGPDISLILFPSSTHSVGFKYVPANGESTLKYKDDAVPAEFITELGESTLKRTNKIKVSEYSGTYSFSFNRYWQIGATLGLRQIKGTYSYEGDSPDMTFSQEQSNSESKFYFSIGVRGRTI